MLVAAPGPVSAQAGRPVGMIVDPASQCATSNPFPVGGETIEWKGGCANGRLSGPGVLTWKRGGKVRERDEGTFRNGELDGDATIAFADGRRIYGTYSQGRRNGEFIVERGNGSYLHALYSNDQLVWERPMTRDQMRNLLTLRRKQGAGHQRRVAQAPLQAPAQVAARAPVVAAPNPRPTVQRLPLAPPSPAATAPTTAYRPAAPPRPQSSDQIVGVALANPPPWSPLANVAALHGQPVAAPAPVYAPAQVYTPAPAYAPVQNYAPAYSQAPSHAAAPTRQPYSAPAAYRTPAPAQAMAAPVSAMTGRRVCTAPGIYPGNSRWCGVVRAQQAGDLQVEVADVHLGSLLEMGFSGSECTGGAFIGRFSHGDRVWVPARCMR